MRKQHVLLPAFILRLVNAKEQAVYRPAPASVPEICQIPANNLFRKLYEVVKVLRQAQDRPAFSFSAALES
jgi:hypothetical protein